MGKIYQTEWNNLIKFSSICLLLGGINLINPLVTYAQENNQIEIDYETPAFTNRQIEADDIKISVSYQPYDYTIEDESGNLTYEVYYNDQLQFRGEEITVNWGQISLQNLDNDPIPEITIATFSGGAHCCTNNIVYDWQDDQFNRIELGFRDGNGGEFEDLDGDGNMEFVTFDNSFLYRFSSYAGSFPPTMIFSFNNGEFENVTTEYPHELRQTLEQMYQSFLSVKNSDYPDVNGILAGYVAQKILLGEYEEGWQFMLNHYDKTSDWGVDYGNFPDSLEAFLIEQGYLYP
jgi:hypothetical protein